jgi:hypothetical protein
LVVNPGDTIAEADETNNAIEATFTWADGLVDAPESPQAEPASAPDPLGKPNLMPYWRFGWGGPIMLSTKVNSEALHPVIAGADQVPYIRLAITNESLLGANAYAIDLFFDGKKITTYEFRALTGGYIQRTRSDATLLAGLNPAVGPHTLRFMINPENAIDEANEDDNVYELTVEWLAPASAAAEPTTYAGEELSALFDGFADLLDDPRPVLGADPSAAGVERTADIADPAYFLATGASMRDSP